MTQINFEFSKQRLEPLIKWAGGKEKELKYIVPNLPSEFENFYEPFVGGGSVYTAIAAKKYFINDKSTELIDFYKIIYSEDKERFFDLLEEISYHWELIGRIADRFRSFFIPTYKEFRENEIDEIIFANRIYEFIINNAVKFNSLFSSSFNFDIENFLTEIKINLVRKISRMKILEVEKGLLNDDDIVDNIKTALKSAFYMHFRHMYNNHEKYKINKIFATGIFYFIRNFAYSGMFRYNLKGEFNVPYGGMGYNNKSFKKKIAYLQSMQLQILLQNTIIECEDFEDFFNIHPPTASDFIFLDPPYDSEFSTYAKNEFGKEDQIRLANYLLNDCQAKWMMIIKKTDFILNLYDQPDINITSFNKKYLVSFMNRNDKQTQHLLIKNY